MPKKCAGLVPIVLKCALSSYMGCGAKEKTKGGLIWRKWTHASRKWTHAESPLYEYWPKVWHFPEEETIDYGIENAFEDAIKLAKAVEAVVDAMAEHWGRPGSVLWDTIWPAEASSSRARYLSRDRPAHRAGFKLPPPCPFGCPVLWCAYPRLRTVAAGCVQRCLTFVPRPSQRMGDFFIQNRLHERLNLRARPLFQRFERGHGHFRRARLRLCHGDSPLPAGDSPGVCNG